MFEIAEAAQTIEFRLLLLTFLILAGPIIAEKARAPGLVGLIFLGMVFGPFVLGWLVPAGLVGVVGAIGLLYLMFLAGIELDINTFVANRTASITFGLLTFAIPFGLSFVVGLGVLDYAVPAAALIGAMWASHTLVAYTEVKEAGLESNRAIGAAVSSTVITDVLALAILGFAASTELAGPETQAAHEDVAVMPVWLGILVLAGFCLWFLPKATNWFFVNVGRTRIQRFVWTIGAMSAGAFVSLLGGIEGLVGAFLAGIGINRLVPASGQLMERIEFFGAALFVPAFLVTVGMSIDPSALAEPSTIALALLFTAMVVVGKVVAAVAAGLIFKFSWVEIGMMASLTVGQAAATLAIAQVGVANEIFDQEVLNAAVLTVVITVILTSLGTRVFSRKMEPPPEDASAIGKHVLLRVPASGSMAGNLDIGVAITRPDDGLLTPYIICGEVGCRGMDERLTEAVQGARERGHDSEGISRVSSSTLDGTLNLSTEVGGSMLLLPWSGPKVVGNLFFGDGIDEIGERSAVTTVAARILEDHWNRVLFFQGRSRGLTVRQEDEALALEVARRVAHHKEIELVVFAREPDRIPESNDYSNINQYSGRVAETLSVIAAGDMVVLPAHVAEDALGLGFHRVSKGLNDVSLLIVGGPRRLHVARRPYADRVLGGAAFNRRSREALPSTWEQSWR